MRTFCKVLGFSCVFALQVWAFPLKGSCPVGEEAHYKIDRSRSRTSALITGGTFHAKVAAYLPEHADGPSYQSHFNYDLQLQFVGRRQGEGDIFLSEEYFNQEFMKKLRQEKIITTDRYTAEYLGLAKEVTTIEGQTYADVDMVQLTNINLMQQTDFLGFVQDLLILEADKGDAHFGLGDFKDLKIKAFVKQADVPVLGAIKVDFSGVYKGIAIKAGFDFQKPKESPPDQQRHDQGECES